MNKLIAVLALGVLAGCSNGNSSSTKKSSLSLAPASQRSVGQGASQPRAIEESDLFKLDGNWLYVQNPTRGLTMIDVSVPDAPILTGQVASVVGKAGELYVRPGDVIVVFEESAQSAGQAEVCTVLNPTTAPSEGDRLLVPGVLVVSRLIGSILYVVSAQPPSPQAPPETWLTSVDVSNPLLLTVLDQQQLSGESHEAHVSSTAIYLAQWIFADPVYGTRLRYVDITDPTGLLVERGGVDLKGDPQGRFHMDEEGATFRIVTFTNRRVGSNLYTIDVSNPDTLTVLGSIEGLAPGEDLHATRFEGDKAYVVTYLHPVVTINCGDPVWVIDLADPANPTVLGELIVPGWSEFVFPRGDYLIGVGRGTLGARVAVSLFDIRDLTNPLEVRRLEFGIPEASSEANTDFRGVRIVEAGVLGPEAMIVVPYTNNFDTNGVCTPEHHVQLIDLFADDIALRGQAAQVGLVRRTVPIGDRLYAITDKTVAAMNVTDRDFPVNATTLNVGDLSTPEVCTPVWIDTPTFKFEGGCQLGAAPAAGAPLSGLAALALLVLLGCRQRQLP